VDLSAVVVSMPYTVSDVSGNTALSYKVTPYYSGVAGTASSSIDVTTNIQAPSNLSANWVDSSGAMIQFTVPKNTYNSAVYTVYTTGATASGTSSPLLLTGLTANTSYDIYGNVVLDGTIAAAMTGNVMITTYGIINSFTVGTIASTSVVLSWTGIYSNVIIYYGTSSGSTTYNTGIIGGTTTTITGLTSGSTYYFNIYPYNSNGIVGTKYTEVTTTYGIINSFTVGTITSTSCVLSWTATYSNVIIYYGTSSGSTTYNTGLISGTTTTIADLTSGSTYYFNIYPYNSNGIVGTKYNTELTNIIVVVTTTNATVTTNGSYKVYAFTGSTGTMTISRTATLYILAVAGGGTGGSDYNAGGGGAGGVVQATKTVNGAETINITIGAGGSGLFTVNSGHNSGSNTVVAFSTYTSNNITAIGGGAASTTTTKYVSLPPLDGGSGGGGGGKGTSGQGYDGAYVAAYGAGGGGGAGSVGDDNGGDGVVCSLNGISTSIYGSYYWGGGGGSGTCAATTGIGYNGGKGGGGAASGNITAGIGGGSALNTGGSGQIGYNKPGGSGGANTGGGGGGGSQGHNSVYGGSGGSGIVLIAIPI
jgi:hypothetical protein